MASHTNREPLEFTALYFAPPIRVLAVEFLYQPLPSAGMAAVALREAMHTRLRTLTGDDALLWLLAANDTAAYEQVRAFARAYPTVPTYYRFVDPAVYAPEPALAATLGWDDPQVRYHRVNMSDRWARLQAALELGAALGVSTRGWLLLPALDAVFGDGLLERMLLLSEHYQIDGIPAAISPFTPYQHAPVRGLEIDPHIIDAYNLAFDRDPATRWLIERGEFQQFWGKCGLLPYAMCETVLREADTGVWEDDREISRVLRDAGYSAHCWWEDDPLVYHQAPPVFSEHDLYTVLVRYLHYSLNIPFGSGKPRSMLNEPVPEAELARRQSRENLWEAHLLAERLIERGNRLVIDRVKRFGASWVDWGRYRYLATVGQPHVDVFVARPGGQAGNHRGQT
jgi:hypothetical protein